MKAVSALSGMILEFGISTDGRIVIYYQVETDPRPTGKA
jgi:hypothetical protein